VSFRTKGTIGRDGRSNASRFAFMLWRPRLFTSSPPRTMLDDPRDASKETKQTLPRGWSKEGIGARTTYHGVRVSLVADDARRARWQTRSRARA
jgi:hypothetical protein